MAADGAPVTPERGRDIVNTPFYDRNQQDTERRPCVKCGMEYFFRPWRRVCAWCEDWPHVAKVNP